MNLTFDKLPEAVAKLYEKLNDIERLILSNNVKQSETDQLLTVKQTAEFLNLSVPTIYGLISKGELPVMKRSKRCYFSKLELINYLKEGRRKTNIESSIIADSYSQKRKPKH